jgi:hypothetical protein
MGMVVMSKRELNRLDVLAWLDSDRLTARAADDGDATASVSAVEKISRWRRFSVSPERAKIVCDGLGAPAWAARLDRCKNGQTEDCSDWSTLTEKFQS